MLISGKEKSMQPLVKSIRAKSLCLEAVHLQSLDSKDFLLAEHKTRFEALIAEDYRWDLRIEGRFSVKSKFPKIDIIVEAIELQFPDKDNQASYIIKPELSDITWSGKKYKNFCQELTTEKNRLVYSFSFHPLRFSVEKEGVGRLTEKDQWLDFWKIMRNFFGYWRVMDSRYEKMIMNIKMRLRYPKQDVFSNMLEFKSEWSAQRCMVQHTSCEKYWGNVKYISYEPVNYHIPVEG